ncbi:mismatch-specific DNA-glycosylase [Sphaerisporangium melleum]|uniref:Mismatch-specific DNA-glycosylase n=1 Tax=Sphaerisporangium melleum TaxID=321316 RepID=A0A917R341_9ACTN|nr:G/U mismatch-specific DNA glycosylase [Sphaerisporangium melleum]GGK85208.1 mismatch-specific DNA-glycosylase [Sphaerisporangium melleum]GII70510.1 mismatch-specific DNA-glycosylase [Sphaerisporangium melleum]
MTGMKADLETARGRTLDDVLGPRTVVLFCGINPGLYSAATGHHFARPGNRFWPALHLSGFTPRLLHPSEQRLLPSYGLGITNLVPRPTARAAELSQDELRLAPARLARLAATGTGVEVVAVVGVSAYRVAFDRPKARIGPAEETVGAARLWVLPNPSGLNAHYTLPALTAEFRRLRDTVVLPPAPPAS